MSTLRTAAMTAALATLSWTSIESPMPARWAPSETMRPAHTEMPLRVGNVTVPLRVMALPILPDATVEIAPAQADAGRLEAVSKGGTLRRLGRDRWLWTAPSEPGIHPVRMVSPQRADTVDLTFLVLRPASEISGGVLNGYRIGSYRARPASMSPRYEPPRGFIEARTEDYDILVSPNFRLGQFLCKDPGDPRYLLVSPRLIIKLEGLLEAVNEAGYSTPGLTVMSGFRTPAYNRAIGNTTDFSRHLWGDAADVYVDNDGDGQMDDVNGDGRSDTGDARWLADVIEGMMAKSDGAREPGGLSIYRPNAVHGPFVHLDTRGHRARW